MPTVNDYTALLSGDSWNGLEVNSLPAVITYSFSSSAPATDQAVLGSTAFGTYATFTNQQKIDARAALAEWAAASGITFVEVPAGQSDITFSAYDFSQSSSSGVGGIGFYPFGDWNYYSYPNFFDGGFDVAGHVLLNTAMESGGRFNYGLMLHEIGHVLGLKHPTEDFHNYASGVDHNQVLASDNGSDTVMTQQPNGPQHLQALDIAAIQHVYGTDAMDGSEYAAWAYNSGSNSFTFTALATGGFTRGSAVDDTITGSAQADRMVGLTGNDVLHGLAGNDALFGGMGNDTLDGGTGGDSLYGGKGDDTYVVDNAGDVVTEFAAEGTDTVQASVSYVLVDNVENLTLTGTLNRNGYGNALDNVIHGNSGANGLKGYDGNDTLDGGLGADTMVGGNGNDSYYVDDAGDVVTESANQGTDTVYSALDIYTLGSNVENLTLIATVDSAGIGNTLNNVITGNSGDNYLDGGKGSDTLIGGQGNDTYVIDSVGDVMVENTDEGTDTVWASFSYTLGANFENLILTGTLDRSGYGNALDNALTGNSGNNSLKGYAGNDVLDGAAGADTLSGGLGDDTYFVDNTGDVVSEAAGQGTDRVYSALSAYTLGANVENLILSGSGNSHGTGNSLNNAITGNSGDNVLDGGAGADTLTGGYGDDTYVIDSTADVINENAGAGIDTVQASFSYVLGDNLENLVLLGTLGRSGYGNGLDNHITGNSGNNSLKGYAGNDTLDGGAGADTLAGGLGADVFLFTAGSGADTIADFTGAQNDVVNVNAYTHGTVHNAYLHQVGADTTIDLGSGNIITVKNVLIADLSGHIVW